MSFILNIDTTGVTASVFISRTGEILSLQENHRQNDHAAFLHPAIKTTCEVTGIKPGELAAISVCNGPGSYTGIRVGLAAAKGLALALKLPLILVDSLSILAKASINETGKKNALFCSMIDARRMEVFLGLYNNDLSHIISPSSIELDENFLANEKNEIVFAGSGTEKFKPLFRGTGSFLQNINIIKAFSDLSNERFQQGDFDDIVNSDAFYVKEFHDNSKK